MLAPIRLTNAAAQLPCGSGETQGEASPPPIRTTPAPTRLFTGKGAMQASSPPIRTAPAPTRLIERVAHWWKLVQHQGRYAGSAAHCRKGLLILHQAHPSWRSRHGVLVSVPRFRGIMK